MPPFFFCILVDGMNLEGKSCFSCLSLGKAFLFIGPVYDFYGHVKSVLLYYYRSSIQEVCIKSNICVV